MPCTHALVRSLVWLTPSPSDDLDCKTGGVSQGQLQNPPMALVPLVELEALSWLLLWKPERPSDIERLRSPAKEPAMLALPLALVPLLLLLLSSLLLQALALSSPARRAASSGPTLRPRMALPQNTFDTRRRTVPLSI